MSLLCWKPPKGFPLHLECTILLTKWGPQGSANPEPSTTLQPNLKSLSPSSWLTGLLAVLQKHHSFVVSWSWNTTLSLPGNLPNSQPGNSSSVFQSGLHSYFLGPAFPGLLSKAGLTPFSFLKRPPLCLHSPSTVLLVHIYWHVFLLWVLVWEKN